MGFNQKAIILSLSKPIIKETTSFLKVFQLGMQFENVKSKVKLSCELLLPLIFSIRLLLFVTCYLNLFYLKLALTCKNLFILLVVVRLVIFLTDHCYYKTTFAFCGWIWLISTFCYLKIGQSEKVLEALGKLIPY